MVSTTEEIWDSSLDTNLRAPFFCAQAAAPWLRRTEGVIINFADTGGLRGWTGFIPHSISKAGVIMLTRSEEHTSELQSRLHLVCRLLLEKKKSHTLTHQWN